MRNKRITNPIHWFFLFTMALILFSFPQTAHARDITFINTNENGQNYAVWSYPVNTYLIEENNGYTRIDANTDKTILLEHYNKNFQYVSQRWIPKELTLFGGFYAGKDAYYFVFGQDNEECSDTKEVIRVVKYDKSWNKLLSVSISKINTMNPFKHGTLRMTECDGKLYIHTSHKMYDTHQANLTIVIDEATMAVEHVNADCDNLTSGYVSHSFNQFIFTDGEYIYRADHGDGAPRKIVLTRCEKAVPDKIWCQDADTASSLDIVGPCGRNSTGASVGGANFSEDYLLTVGNSRPQDDTITIYTPDRVRNIWVSTSPKSSMVNVRTANNPYNITATESKTTTKWLTNYKEGTDLVPSTPCLVKINNNAFLIMWNLLIYDSDDIKYCLPSGQFCYAFMDGQGNLTSSIYTKDGSLSDCAPIVSDGKIVWFTAYNDRLAFYTIAMNGTLTEKNVTFPKTIYVYPKNVNDCQLIFNKIGDIKTKTYRNQMQVYYEGHILEEEVHYGHRGESGGSVGSGKNKLLRFANMILIGYTPYYYGRAELKTVPIRKKPVLLSVKKTGKKVKITWDPELGSLGYKIYRKEGNGKFKLVKTINNDNITTWTDTYQPKKKTNIQYAIKAYTQNKKGKQISTGMSNNLSVYTWKSTVSSYSVKVSGKNVKVKIKKVKKAKGYEIMYSTMPDFTENTKTKTTTKTSYTIKDAKKKYGSFIRVRPYYLRGKAKVYGQWSLVKGFYIP